MELKRVEEILEKAKEQTQDSIKIIEDLTKKYVDPLDKVMTKIRNKLESDYDYNINDYNIMLMELSSYLYFANNYEKEVGSMVDVAEGIRLDQYNKAIQSTTGTKTDKEAFAAERTIDERFVSDAVLRAYKDVKGKVDAGIRMMDSIKKCHNAKINEMQLFQRDRKIMES